MERDLGLWIWAIINNKLTLKEEASILLQNIKFAPWFGGKSSDPVSFSPLQWQIWPILKTPIFIYCVCIFSCSFVSDLCDPMGSSPPGSSVHGFCKQEYWSGLPFPTPGDLPDPGIEPTSPASSALAGGFFTTVPAGKPIFKTVNTKIKLWSDFPNNNNITWSTNRGVILITMDCTQMWVYSKIFFAHLPWKWTLGSYVTSP